MKTPDSPRCSHIPSCELFPKFGLRSSLKVWTTFYCEGEFARCARYQQSLRGEPVPTTLLPNGRHLNLELLVKGS